MKILFTIIITIFISLLISCDKTNPVDPDDSVNPFDNGGFVRNMIVVMSDMHLGADLEYAECKDNL